MNELIKELAEQANILIGKDSYGKFAVIPGHEKDPLNRQGKAESYDALEKFAELIVRECISQARTEMYTDDEISSEEDPLMLKLSLASNVGVESAVEAIQNHFGVKE